MDTHLRRSVTLLTTAALVASLAVVTATAPATAQPTCDGRAATITDNGPGDNDPDPNSIVGTNGNDVIVGTNGDDTINGLGGRDRICGRAGDDSISGGAGRDRIFGGSDSDAIFGNGGPDDLFGFNGNDFIRGNIGNDLIKGGRGFDNCKQGPGSGPVRQCERADLGVRVTGPPSPTSEGILNFKVKVRNRGPQRTSYELRLTEDHQHLDCDAPWEGVRRAFAALAPGATRTRTFELECVWEDPDAWVKVTAEVFPNARDPRPVNNKDSTRQITVEDA